LRCGGKWDNPTRAGRIDQTPSLPAALDGTGLFPCQWAYLQQIANTNQDSGPRELSLNSNHGHPTVAATAHPALFKGPGIIAAHPGKPIAAVTPEGHRKALPANPAAIPGNKAGPGNAVTGPGNKVGPGNAAIGPGNQAGPAIKEHKGNAGGGATPGAGNTASPEIKEHKANTGGGPARPRFCNANEAAADRRGPSTVAADCAADASSAANPRSFTSAAATARRRTSATAARGRTAPAS
jgi:hypothetical protein